MADEKKNEVTEPPPLAEALSAIVRRVMFRGRRGLEQAATQGRHRLELRQLQHDRDQFWMRLGKTAYHLVEAGELDHVALKKAMVRIDEIEAQIRKLQGGSDGDGS